MPRPERIFFEGALYHVYNRLGRGEQSFLNEDLARAFVDLLAEVVERDGLTVHAWCLMSNHYHLAVRTGVIPLNRPMKSLQQKITRRINNHYRVFGALWQGRYKAKLVEDGQYIDRLLSYIHLNPVSAGLVSDPAEYPWSGHLELLGKQKQSIVDVDAVLRVFGKTRRSARAAYVRSLNVFEEEEWIGEQPGHLPWWRLGRPPKGEDEDPEVAIRKRREREELGPEWRPKVRVEQFIIEVASNLGLDLTQLRSRGRTTELSAAREILMVLGVERYQLPVKDLAALLHQSPDGMSKALKRGIRKRSNDVGFRDRLNTLDHKIMSSTTRPAE